MEIFLLAHCPFPKIILKQNGEIEFSFVNYLKSFLVELNIVKTVNIAAHNLFQNIIKSLLRPSLILWSLTIFVSFHLRYAELIFRLIFGLNVTFPLLVI